MSPISKYPIITLITILVINILLAFFLIAILADGILKYKIGFVVNLPIILLILIALILTYSNYFSRKQTDFRNISTTITLIVLGLIIMVFYTFNVFCWIDLFDGKTNALLP